MPGVNVIAADTNEEAERLASSQYLQFLNMQRGVTKQLQPPIDNMDEIWTPMEKAAVFESLDPRTTIVGDPETVKKRLTEFQERTKADEIIISSQIYHLKDRLRSYEIISELFD
jgi:alkanesulfonate monooxygenase SsuD/methylene tetrahydromethanopterin reductase-like flavin-dependent oxidoreductase (luciferase family)